MKRSSERHDGDVPDDIEGMTLLEELRRDGESAVYRARREGSFYEVHLYPPGVRSKETLTHLKREATVRASLKHPLIPSSYDVGIAEGLPYMVTDLVQGEPLRTRLEDATFSEETAVAVVDAVAGALVRLHAHGLIHGNLSTTSLYWSEADGLKLVDFDLSPDLSFIATSDAHEGERGYRAPEQIGLLEHPVDGRADLYVLGAVLFESLTGRSPFEVGGSDNAFEHHYAVAPPSLEAIDPDVSPALAAIVDKLLSGHPKDRYQSGRNVKADLKRLEAFSQRVRAGLPLHLGSNHTLIETEDRRDFIGRDRELETFRTLWEEARDGTGGLALVEGPAGSGKTRLLEEICQQVVDDKLRILQGTCAASSPVPFAPLRAAIEDHIDVFEALPPDERDRAVERLEEAAGDFQGVLEALSPHMLEVFGHVQSTDVEREEHDVFYNAMATFLLELADRYEGLFLWLDDLQWLDNASRQVLQLLLPQLSDHALLVAVSMRNEEGSDRRDWLHETTERSTFHDLELGPFEVGDIGELISAELGERHFESSFIEDIAERSGGNPLIVQQDLRAMRDEGRLSPHWGAWKLEGEVETERDDESGPAAVLERRARQLDDTTREILRAASILGDSFSLDQLEALIEEPSSTRIHRAVREGRESELLIPSLDADRYVFTHDYVRDTFESELSEERVTALHQRAALYLERSVDLEHDRAYECARHFMAGRPSEAPEAFSRACFRAARSADAEYAFEDAYEFLKAIERVETRDPSIDDGAYFQLFGRACLRTERFDAAIDHFREALEVSDASIERARLRSGIARAHDYQLHTEEAMSEAARAFDEIGVSLPTSRWNATFAIVLTILRSWIAALFLVWTRFWEGSARDETDRMRYETLVHLYNVGSRVGYYSRDALYLLQCAVCTIRPAHYLKPSRAYSLGFVHYSTVASLIGATGTAETCGRRALEVAEDLEDRQTLAITKQMLGLSKSMAGRHEEAVELNEEVLSEDADWLDARSFLFACRDLISNYTLRGYHYKAVSVARMFLKRYAHRNGSFWDVARTILQASAMSSLSMLGEFDEADEYRRNVLDERGDIPSDRVIPWVTVWGYMVSFYWQQRAFDEPFREALERHEAFEIPPERSIQHSGLFYIHRAYARLEVLMTTERTDLEPLREAIDALERAGSTEFHEHHLEAVRGGLARLESKRMRADATLERAVSRARDQDNPWAFFEATRQRAWLHRDRGDREEARQVARRARSIASELRWTRRIAWLEDTFDLDPIRD